MMFATLDDLESSVELLVFGKALSEHEDALIPDSIVLVRGRVDHRDREKTSSSRRRSSGSSRAIEDVQAAREQELKAARPPAVPCACDWTRPRCARPHSSS